MPQRQRKRSAIWNRYTLSDNHTAVCNACEKEVRYCGNTTNLTKHVQLHHGNFEQNGQPQEQQPQQDVKPPMKMVKIPRAVSSGESKKSLIWAFYNKTSDNVAVCCDCKKEVRYCGNTTNLFKHMMRNHPTISLPEPRKQERRTPIVSLVKKKIRKSRAVKDGQGNRFSLRCKISSLY